ncbi:hypothetical protein CRENBAI_003080 [Crenichthys baileyi]|uniref:Uncharacterized protein n=1 Tax=Crenichthys baileyi TaxID=28760 RepID=A0AAV9RNH6_9TELE
MLDSCQQMALDRSETRRDGGFKHSWSFSLPGDSETEKRQEASVVSVEEMERQQMTSPEEKSPPLRHYSSSDPLRTYGNRSNAHIRSLNRLGPRRSGEVPLPLPTPSSTATRTNFNLILTSALAPGIMLQGRHFQHAQVPSIIRKPVQSSCRNSCSSTQQAVEVDSIVLTCPEPPEEETLNIKRRVQQKRKPLENVCFSPQLKVTEPVRTTIYHTVCLKCNKPSEDSSRCLSCGSSESLVGSQSASSSPTPRPSIRSQPSPGPNGIQQNFYKPGATMKEPPPVRITGSRAAPLPLSNGRIPLLAGTSSYCRPGTPTKGKTRAAGQQPELNDPIVLSSDDEEEEAETGSTGSVNRLDNVSPRPADSAHSSPVPSGGRVEAAVKSADEQEELNAEFFEDVSTKITIPRRARMKDQFGNQPPAEQLPPKRKKAKVTPTKCDSIILECRSVRIGTLRRMVTNPVIFCSSLSLNGRTI